jgi:hypothetical protein
VKGRPHSHTKPGFKEQRTQSLGLKNTEPWFKEHRAWV